MALHITPLGQPLDAPASGGLRIRPLDDFLRDLPALTAATGGAPAPRPQGPLESFDFGGGGGPTSSGATNSGPDVTLATPSNVLSLFSGSPLAINGPSALNQGVNFGLGLLGASPFGAMFGGQVAALSARAAMAAHANLQAEQTLRNEQPQDYVLLDMIARGSNTGQAPSAANLASMNQGGQISLPAFATLTQGLGITPGQLNAISQAAPFGQGPRGGIDSDPDGGAPGAAPGGPAGQGNNPSDSNEGVGIGATGDGGGGGGGGGGSHLCTWAARLLGKEKATAPLRDSFVQEFARKYPGTWKQDFKEYQRAATPLIAALEALPPEEQRTAAERVYREVLKPFAPIVEPDEVDDLVRALERVGYALAKEQGVEIPKAVLEFSRGARRTRMLSGQGPAPKRRPLLKAMGAEA